MSTHLSANAKNHYALLGAFALSMHLRMNVDAASEEIVEAKCKVREALAGEEFEHVTINVELAGEQCASHEDGET